MFVIRELNNSYKNKQLIFYIYETSNVMKLRI